MFFAVCSLVFFVFCVLAYKNRKSDGVYPFPSDLETNDGCLPLKNVEDVSVRISSGELDEKSKLSYVL